MKKGLMILFLVAVLVSVLAAQDGEEKIKALEKRIQELEIAQEESSREESGKQNSLVIESDAQWGQSWGLEISGGTFANSGMGSLGLFFPRIGNALQIGLRADVISSSAPKYIFNNDGSLADSYNNVLLQGGLFVNFGSPVLFNFTRVYGGAQCSMGYSFFVDSDQAPVNLSMLLVGYGGLEFYSSKFSSCYIEIGGGSIFELTGLDSSYVNALNTGGFFLRFGSRFFLGGLGKE